MSKPGCPAPGCGCTNFQADAFKKEKCCNCFHNHGGGAAPAGGASKPPGPPAAAKATPASPPSAAREMKPASPPREMKLEEKKAPGPPAAAAAAATATAAAPAAGKNVLKITWHQSTRSEQFQLDVTNIQNLEQLDSRLRGAEASLAGKKFEYMCRGQVVARVFWDIFKPEHLFPILFLQEDTAGGDNRARFKSPIPGSTEKKSGFVAPSAASPGFAVPTKVTFQKPVVKVAAVAATPNVAVSKPAVLKADEAWFASRPPLFS